LKQLFSLQKIIVSLVFVFLLSECYASDPFCLKAGAREAGMAGVCTMRNDLWSSFNNQAVLSYNKSIAFGFNYENRFAIKELGIRSAGFVFPTGSVSLGAVYSNFGYRDFKREMAGLSCGMYFSETISGGVQIDYLSEKTIGEYNNTQALTCEAGIVIQTSENVKTGIHLFNPVPNSIRGTDMPSELRADIGIDFTKMLLAVFETKMRTGQKLVIRTGFEYEAGKKLMLRGGFSTENNSFCFGIGYSTGPAQIDFGFATHEKLGVTSSISLILFIKEK
jgi:hypothetical protein